MSRTRARVGCAGFCAVLGLAAAASAVPINYGNFPGLGSDPDFLNVTEDSITDPTPLFGAPTRVGNSLLFFPTAYASSSSNGTADTTSGTLSMMVLAKPGFFLDTIRIREFGDWTLSGVGSSATSATVNGALFVTDIVPGVFGVFNDILSVTPGMPQTLAGGPSFGVWDGVVEIDLSGLNITMIQLQFNNNLQTTSEAGTTAFIQKKVVQGPSIIIDIPAPSAVAAFGLFGALAARRRR